MDRHDSTDTRLGPEEGASRSRLEFRGGAVGALSPFVLFVGGVAVLGFLGAADERAFWPVLLAALAVGLAVARDSRSYAEEAIRSMSRPVVLLMVMAWLLAGVLATVINASGLIPAMVRVAERAGVLGGGYAVAAFLVCAAVSTATGTSLGTVILCSPLLYPPGGALGTDPAMLMGAILGGATFGDNVSPVSDTTIASALTQRAPMGPVVRSRLRYAVPAAFVAVLIAGLFGGVDGRAAAANAAGGIEGVVAEVTTETESGDMAGNGATISAGADTGAVEGAGAAASTPTDVPGDPLLPLLMLLAPAITIVLLLARRHLLEGLLAGIAVAVVLGLVLGLVEPSQVLRIRPEDFTADGLIVDGLGRGVGVSVITFFLMGIVGGLEASGLTDWLVEWARRGARTVRATEAWIFGVVSLVVLLLTHSAVAILIVGPVARETGERLGIGPLRRSNLLDVTVCTYPFLLPYCVPTILAASTTVGAVGMPRLSPFAVGLHNVHSWALLAVMVVAVLTGYGRGDDDTFSEGPPADPEPGFSDSAADGPAPDSSGGPADSSSARPSA